ncbi:MAG: hypothetical protein RR945_02290 [Erysipelotrichaceae bacterium]
MKKIVFVSDTDGCYIDDENIFDSEQDDTFRYEDDGIYTCNVNNVIKRNKQKTKNLNVINSTNTIFYKKFEAYYFSCNLDHVLHGERNLLGNDKRMYAIEYADSFFEKEFDFISFISEKSLAPIKTYRKSWEFIKLDNNSILRYTNFNTFFLNNYDYLREEMKKFVK